MTDPAVRSRGAAPGLPDPATIEPLSVRIGDRTFGDGAPAGVVPGVGGDRDGPALDPGQVPSPIQLFVEMTSQCNLRCSHCYVRAGEGRVRQLAPRVLHELLYEFAMLNGVFVSFSGGESMLYRGWRPAVRAARHLDLSATILTNATIVSDDDIDFLEETSTRIAISLDGGTPATHEQVRGEGTFAATCAAMARMARRGLGERMLICFTPMAHNVGELSRIVRLADDLGIGTVYISLLEDRGRAHDVFDATGLDVTAKTRLLYSMFSLQERYPHVHLDCPNLRFFTERLHGADVDADDLDRTIRVTADGDLYLTAYLDDEPFALGRYEPGLLQSLWQNRKVARAFTAAAARRQLVAQCRTCEAQPWCRGGCATFAWTRNATFYGVDSYCEAKRRLVEMVGLAHAPDIIHS